MGEPVSIDRYRVVRKLGKGGMGEVFLAHDESLQRSVAIKRLLTEGARNLDERRARFLGEGRKLARLKHPHIVKVFDILDELDPPAMVMEYIEGSSLRTCIAEGGALPPSRVVYLGLQIADAMVEIHAQGIVHRDLKSENVLIDRAGNAKVTDFGIARAAGDETLTAEGTILGTPGAMSPEQMSGKDAGEASDLFLFGILLYEALTGKRPFRGTRDEILLAMSTYEPPSPIVCNPDVPAELSSLVDHLLKKVPMSRPRSFRNVAATLKQIDSGLNSEIAMPPAASVVELGALDDSQATEDPVVLPEAPEATEAPEALIARLAVVPESAPDAGTLASRQEAVVATEPAPLVARVAHEAGPGASDPDWRPPNEADEIGRPPDRSDTSQGHATGAKQGIIPAHVPRRTALLLGAASTVVALVAGAIYLQWTPDESEPTDEHRDEPEPPEPPTPTPGPHPKLYAPEPSPPVLRYVAVKIDDVPEDCPPGARFVTRSARNAMEEPLFGLQGVLVVSKFEPELKRLRSESDEVATESLRAKVTCYPNRLDIDIWREVDGVMHQERRSFTIDVSDLGRSDAIQNQVRLLYSDIEPTAPKWRGRARESSVQELREVTRAYWQEPQGAPIEQFLERLAAIRAASPEFVDAYIFEAELLQHRYRKTPDMDDLDRAWELVKQAEELDPSWQPTLTRLFSIAMARNDITEAERILKQIAAVNPGDGFTHYMWGLLHDNQDDTERAHEAFRLAERHPSWRIRYYLAKLDVARCQLDDAWQGIAYLEKHWPDNPAVLELKGQLLGRTNPAAAMVFFLGWLDDGYPKIANQGVLLMSLQRYREAIRLLEKAIASENRARRASLGAIYSMAEAYALLGQKNQADRLFQEVLSLLSAERRNSDAMALRALVYAHQQQAEKAREAIGLALKREDMDIYYAAATVYALIGDTDEARDWTERALECGYAREWFHYPWFEAVRQSPQLGRRLGGNTTSPP